MEQLFQETLGMPWECYFNLKQSSVLEKLQVPWYSMKCPCPTGCTAIPPTALDIEVYMQEEASNIVKAKLGCLLNGWSRHENTGATNSSARTSTKFTQVMCRCEETLSLNHFLDCPMHHRLRERLKSRLGSMPSTIVANAKSVLTSNKKALKTWSGKLKALTAGITGALYPKPPAWART